jgi:DNA-binding MarR family transcriptional regulator
LQSWLAVVRAYNLCEAVLSQRLAALDLRLPEHEVLINLQQAPGLTQQQLAQRCFVAKSGISMLVSRMEAAGWLLRQADSADARLRRLSLMPAGAALATQCEALQTEVVQGMTDACSAAELGQIAQAMDRAAGVLEAMLRGGVAPPAA